MSSFLNVGVLAHVDAGKTTLTEQMLHVAGAIATPGSVDQGTSVTDTMTVERERGISVRLATASLDWRGTCVNLVDTPGHVDFCAEVERSLRVLDGAVLVVSAVEGVQAHTSTIFHALRAMNIPTVIFINKLDRVGADVDAVVAEIRRDLTDGVVVLQRIRDQAESSATPVESWSPTTLAGERTPTLPEAIVETLAETDELLLERYLEGETLSFEELDLGLARATASGELVPVALGVAKRGLGVPELLDALLRYLPHAAPNDDEPLSAVVYRIDHHPKLGRVANVRVYAGSLKPRDAVHNRTRDLTETVSQIKRSATGKLEDVRTLAAGDIGTVCGLSAARVGDVLGTGEGVPRVSSLAAPLLTVKVTPADEAEFSALATALNELNEEDPLLGLEYLAEQRELHLRITGWIQIEVLESVLQERFGISAAFSNPTIVYKETPSGAGFGFERYWMPKPCWAIVKLHIEPLPRGSGVVYESRVSVDDIAQKYQNEVAQTIPQALQQGTKGWEVTDLKLTLVEGEDHPVHSRPGNFKTATPMAVMNGLAETSTTLLEPILEFRVMAARELLGTITADLARLRATFDAPEVRGERFVLEGRVPAATSLEYPVQLASRSGGKAKIFTRLWGYEPCTLEQGRTTPYRGVSPLDRANYILQARGGLKG